MSQWAKTAQSIRHWWRGLTVSPGIQHHRYLCCTEMLKALEAQRNQQELWGKLEEVTQGEVP